MNRIFLVLTIFGVATACFADPVLQKNSFRCGNSQVVVFNSDNIRDPNFRIVLSQGSQKLRLSYSVQQEILFVRCEKTIKGESLLLVNNVCGGSSCTEHNFGIIDPQHLKVLLTPNQRKKGNNNSAEKILGRPIKPFSCKSLSNEEFCYVSPLELG